MMPNDFKSFCEKSGLRPPTRLHQAFGQVDLALLRSKEDLTQTCSSMETHEAATLADAVRGGSLTSTVRTQKYLKQRDLFEGSRDCWTHNQQPQVSLRNAS